MANRSLTGAVGDTLETISNGMQMVNSVFSAGAKKMQIWEHTTVQQSVISATKAHVEQMREVAAFSPEELVWAEGFVTQLNEKLGTKHSLPAKK